jgi:hypothetical protein
VSPVKYEMGFYIVEDGILLSRRREYLKSYIQLHCLADQNFAGRRVGLRGRRKRASNRKRSCQESKKETASTPTAVPNIHSLLLPSTRLMTLRLGHSGKGTDRRTDVRNLNEKISGRVAVRIAGFWIESIVLYSKN